MGQREKEKRLAAYAAVEYVRNGMVLGVGSGTTIEYFIEALAEKITETWSVTVVPTSKNTEKLCKEKGIVCIDAAAVPTKIDLTVDGADEFDLQLNLIKGGGCRATH